MSGTDIIEDLRRLAPASYGWLLGLAALAIGVVLLKRAFWRRRLIEGIPSVAVQAGVSAWDVALAELERLAHLLRSDRSRDYSIAVTTVLRGFVEARYGLQAPRLTTEELLAVAGASAELPDADRRDLGGLLELCDLCKFGRSVASVEELRELHVAAVAFVLRSRPGVGGDDERGSG